MFGKLFGRDGERPAADTYALPVPGTRRSGVHPLRALGDTRVMALVRAAEDGDWEGIKETSAPFDLGRDHRVLGQLAEIEGIEEWIGRPVRRDKEHRATALLISGLRHVTWGWEARTDARAVDVTQEQWKIFHERLHIAEEHLLEAAELRPEWITPWRQLLVSGRGMSVGAAVQETRLAAALRRAPLDPQIHAERVTQLQPRWGGEPGAALAYAREVYATAPEGHPLGCVIAFAHIEEWVESDRQDCLETRAIRQELCEAARHSILHPAYVRTPGWQYDFNAFAMALSLAAESKVCARLFHELGGAFTSWPWAYLAEPEEAYGRARRRA
ncbi:hypothetical protein AB0D49_20390 [Streptomyces sp. NPDC048290]|uniref:hypothetical protein n=1 Tax=Streptomyces sp. NPDC048290 TaxID=3155811 RepID=UPI003413BC1C